jgi:hypothetical protein
MEEGPRCSDAERERVVAALQRHFADGRLTADELNDRLDRVLTAATLGQLYALMSDLPELPVVEAPHRGSTSTRRRRWWRG